MQSGGGDGGGSKDGNDWPFRPADPGAQASIEFAPATTPSPEEAAAAAAKREENLRNLLKGSLSRASAKLVEVDRRATPAGGAAAPKPPAATPKVEEPVAKVEEPVAPPPAADPVSPSRDGSG